MCKKDGKIWDKFVEWCEKHGVDFTPQHDYELLWKCWYDSRMEAETKELYISVDGNVGIGNG